MKHLFVSLFFTITFTNPSFNSDNSCGTSLVPLTDLSEVRVYGDPGHQLLATKDEGHREGLADSLSFPLPSWVALLEVTAVDSSGNESCPQQRSVPATTGVDCKPKTKPERVVWYDVAGRRVQEPDHSGVYIRVQGNDRRKVVILR